MGAVVAAAGATTSNLTVGNSNTGMLTIQSGGTVSSSCSFPPSCSGGVIGSAAGSQGRATVTGAGSTWTSNGSLTVGSSGMGTLTIANGGTLSSSSIFPNSFPGALIGSSAGSQGTVTVTGAGSTWTNTAGLIVGDLGTGTLTIADGGTVRSGGASVGSLAGSQGTATVTGKGSTWTNNGGFFIGSLSTGTLTIADGGTVSSSSQSNIGTFDGSQGTVTVTGPGSTWTNNGALLVGSQGGTSTLTIANGGTVVSESITVAFLSGSIGTLNIGSGPGDPPAAPGTLNAAAVSFFGGTGTINFNHTAADYVFAPVVSGFGTVNVLAGTTIFTGDNGYFGGTNISQGATLQLGNGGMSGSIIGNVADGGTLSFNRSDTVAFPGLISGTGTVKQIGSGTTILSGANTYTGGTTVSDDRRHRQRFWARLRLARRDRY